MDDFVQNVKIDSIIPTEFQNTDDDEINDLAISIKKYGIIEPLLVRPKDGKYEILSGKKRYQASRIIGLDKIPVLIRNIDDDVYNEYHSNNKENEIYNKFIKPIQKEKISSKEAKKIKRKKDMNSDSNNTEIDLIPNIYNQNKNPDVINLSELNKKEYERDEIKMNNNMMNEQNIQPQNLNNVQNQEPTFGGRFFPSLEDEPTNMNMDGMNIIGQAMQNAQTITNNQPISNNNLIDLTDVNSEKEQQLNVQPQQNYGVLEQNQPEYLQQNTIIGPSQPEVGMNPSPISQPTLDNTITNPMAEFSNPQQNPTTDINIQQSNLDPINVNPQYNLNNSVEMQTPQNISETPILNNTSNITQIEQPQSIPQFDMSQSVTPTDFSQHQEIGLENPTLGVNPVNPIEQIPNYMNQTNSDIQPIENNSIPTMEQTLPVQPNLEQPVDIPQQIMQPAAEPQDTMQQFPQKEVEPVVSSLKNLASNLQDFGYNIGITEEDLGDSVRLTIEIKK